MRASGKWLKGSRAKFKSIIEDDVRDNMNRKASSYTPKAKQIQKELFDRHKVIDTGQSKRESYVKLKTTRNKWVWSFGVDLDKVPQAPFWYMGWGPHGKIGGVGPRPVYMWAAKIFGFKILGVKSKKLGDIDFNYVADYKK